MTWTPKPEYRLAEDVRREDLADLSAWLATDPAPALTPGPLVRELEKQFAAKVGAKHAVFVNSGSSANLLAWYYPRAFDWLLPQEERCFLPNGDPDQEVNLRVVVPAVSGSTAVMPAGQLGYETVLCEADPDTWGLDVTDLRRICKNVGAPAIVLVAHVLGVPANLKALNDLRKEFGFLLLEDAGEAFGSRPVGTIPDALTTYSTAQGGFVATNGDDAANLLRMIRAHGSAADCDDDWVARLAKAHGVDPFREAAFTFYVPGFDVRGTALQAHLGISQMKLSNESAIARRANHGLYATTFAGAKHVSIQKRGGEGVEVASIGFGVLAASKDHRNKVAEALKARGIETRPIGAGNIAKQPFYPKTKRERPVADRIHDCGLQLPNHPGLTADDVVFIAETVLAVKP